VGFGQVGLVGSHAGIQGDGAADVLGGPRGMAALEGDDAQEMQGVGVVGVLCEKVLVDLRRLIEQATLMITQSRVQVVAHAGGLTRRVEKDSLSDRMRTY
jgi:hypothetical protein